MPYPSLPPMISDDFNLYFNKDFAFNGKIDEGVARATPSFQFKPTLLSISSVQTELACDVAIALEGKLKGQTLMRTRKRT